MITITLDKSIQPQISSVRVGGQAAFVQKPRTEGKLSILLPKLDIVGQADVEVIGKDNKAVAVGQIKYVETMEQSSKVPWGLILLYIVLIAIPPSGFIFYDIYKSYEERTVVLKLPDSTSVDERKALLAAMDQGPTGFTGLTRGILAVMLLLVLGIAIIHLIVIETTSSHIAEQLLTLLAGSVTSIIGFYFGSKASTEAAKPKKSGNGKTGDSVVPKILNFEPVSGTDKKKFKVTGEGFGGKQGTVKIRDKDKGNEVSISVSKWEEKQIEVETATELVTGTTLEISVTNDSGKAGTYSRQI